MATFTPPAPESIQRIARELTVKRQPDAPAQLAAKCPWCDGYLDGEVVATFHNGSHQGLMQTKRIGRNDYVWTHSASGCHVPKLDRIGGYPRRQR